jgi:hypothetical protein
MNRETLTTGILIRQANNPFKQLNVFMATDSQVNELMARVFGQEFNVAGSEEHRNDTAFRTSLDGVLDEGDLEQVYDFFNTGRYESMFITPMLLNYLCNIGILLPGEYVIEISW